MVLATQNPIEHEGTYPLPEAQVDRFLLKLTVRYPAAAEEKRDPADLQPARGVDSSRCWTRSGSSQLQRLAEMVHVDEELMEYIIALSRFTREHRRVYLGVSPRASLMLLHAAKARALIRARATSCPTTSRPWPRECWPTASCSRPRRSWRASGREEIVGEALEKVRYQNRR